MRKMQRLGLLMAIGVLIIGTASSLPVRATIPGVNTLASYDSTGTTTPGPIDGMAHLSEDGNIIVWVSNSHNIIPSDPYSSSTTKTLYKRNLQTGNTSYVSVDTGGAPVDVDNDYFAMSRTGRYVVYASSGTNIVSSPTIPSSPTQQHVYIRDTLLGTTELVDKTVSGTLANIGGGTEGGRPWAVSDDGRFVTFSSQATNLLSSGNPSSPNYSRYNYVKDLQTGQVINPAVSNSGVRANSTTGAVYSSCDGSILVFSSNSTNLTPQDNGNGNVYLIDLRNGFSITNLTYGANAGAGALSISCNGRYVVMGSRSTNLTSDSVSGTITHWFRYDRLTDTYSLVDQSTAGYISTTYTPSNGTSNNGKNLVSDNGLVIFSSDDKSMVSPAASNAKEVYIRDPDLGTTEIVPINSGGSQESPARGSHMKALDISARGNAVLYDSRATNLVPSVTVSGQKLVVSKVE